MPSIDQNIEKWDYKFRNFIEDEDYGYRWSEAWGGILYNGTRQYFKN